MDSIMSIVKKILVNSNFDKIAMGLDNVLGLG